MALCHETVGCGIKTPCRVIDAPSIHPRHQHIVASSKAHTSRMLLVVGCLVPKYICLTAYPTVLLLGGALLLQELVGQLLLEAQTKDMHQGEHPRDEWRSRLCLDVHSAPIWRPRQTVSCNTCRQLIDPHTLLLHYTCWDNPRLGHTKPTWHGCQPDSCFTGKILANTSLSKVLAR